MDISKFEGQVFFTTIRVTVSRDGGEGSSIGTAFFVRAAIPEYPEKFSLLLVSNKHVFHNPRNSVELRFHARDKTNGSLPDLNTYVQYSSRDFSGIYVEHPNSAIDLACLNVSFMNEPKHGVFWKGLPPDMFSSFQEPDLLPGKRVWFVGYPSNRFDVAHNLPILRVGHIASEPTIDFNGQPQFLIDAQVFPGSSGSPVFTTLGRNHSFLGVLTQVMVRNHRLVSVNAAETPGVELGIGLGIVYKAHLVKELVDSVVTKIKLNLDTRATEPTVNEADPEPK